MFIAHHILILTLWFIAGVANVKQTLLQFFSEVDFCLGCWSCAQGKRSYCFLTHLVAGLWPCSGHKTWLTVLTFVGEYFCIGQATVTATININHHVSEWENHRSSHGTVHTFGLWVAIVKQKVWMIFAPNCFLENFDFTNSIVRSKQIKIDRMIAEKLLSTREQRNAKKLPTMERRISWVFQANIFFWQISFSIGLSAFNKGWISHSLSIFFVNTKYSQWVEWRLQEDVSDFCLTAVKGTRSERLTTCRWDSWFRQTYGLIVLIIKSSFSAWLL